MQITFPTQSQRPVSAVRFQATSKNDAWMQKLDTTLQALYKRRTANNQPAFKLDLPIAVYFKPGQITPALRQQLKQLSLEGRTPVEQARTDHEFEFTNVPGAPDSDRMLLAWLTNVNQLKTAAKISAVERIQDSSFWAAWDK
jgi:hypothetical protein